MNLKLANNAVGRLAAAVSAGQTSFSLQTGQGAKFPALTDGDYFTLTASKVDGSREIMFVTARAFDVLTVMRGQENTLALDFDASTIVENRITAKSIMDEIHAMNSLVNAAIGAFQPSVPVGLDQLRILLLNALTVDQLTADLRARIALIDATSATGGSVNQRVKAATDAFIAGLTQEASDRTTYVQNYAFSKANTTAAISAQASTTAAQLTAYADAARQSAISVASADVRSYTYSQAAVNSAISASEQTLRAEFSGGGGGGPSYATQAYVQNYAYSIAQADGAIASQTADLRTTVGNNTTAIQQSAITLNGLSAQVYTKIDSNGYVTGYGLSSSTATGTPTSAFVINAAALKLVAPGVSAQQMFSVGLVNGTPKMVVNGDAYADGTLTARMLRIGGSDNIIPDPKFYDLAWWGRLNAPVGDYTGLNNGWLGGAALIIQSGFGGVRSSTSRAFASTPGATMKLEVQVELSNNYVGNFSIFFYVEGAGLYSMGCPNITPWSNGDYPGWPIQFNGSSTKGRFSFTQTITIPVNSQCANAHMVIVDDTVAGNVAIGSCSATRVVDQTLIGDNSVQTRHLELYYGGHIALGTTDYGAGNGLWFEGAGTGHGARLFAGNSAGAYFKCDPANNILELKDVSINATFMGSIQVTGPGSPSYFTLSRNVIDGEAGQYKGIGAAGSGNYSYAWSVEGNYLATARINGNPNIQEIQVLVTGHGINTGEFDFYATCVITDNQTGVARTASQVFTVNFT